MLPYIELLMFLIASAGAMAFGLMMLGLALDDHWNYHNTLGEKLRYLAQCIFVGQTIIVCIVGSLLCLVAFYQKLMGVLS